MYRKTPQGPELVQNRSRSITRPPLPEVKNVEHGQYLNAVRLPLGVPQNAYFPIEGTRPEGVEANKTLSIAIAQRGYDVSTDREGLFYKVLMTTNPDKWTPAVINLRTLHFIHSYEITPLSWVYEQLMADSEKKWRDINTMLNVVPLPPPDEKLTFGQAFKMPSVLVTPDAQRYWLHEVPLAAEKVAWYNNNHEPLPDRDVLTNPIGGYISLANAARVGDTVKKDVRDVVDNAKNLQRNLSDLPKTENILPLSAIVVAGVLVYVVIAK